ncbi:MAG: AMP-binding protein [Candidatus Marinimicrobia bacterium]|nr:AMP-binding protein [Candidatus Neomarinimicrobiota bacterium]
MAKQTKTIQHAFNSQYNVDDLFATVHSLLDSNNDKDIHEFLEIGHLPSVNQLIYTESKVGEWFRLLHKLILKSNFNVYALLSQRVERYGDKSLFQTISANNIASTSFNDVWKLVQSIGSYFQTTLGKNDTIGILTPNHLNGIIIDLACLAYNIRIVPVPMNLSSDHLDYVLDHAEISHLFIGGGKARESLKDTRRSPSEFNAVQIDDNAEWNGFVAKCSQSKIVNPISKGLQSLATIMYTSGTTDNPKGIIFNQENIITKRFARALALPEIGPNDSFLCYLPLYHTFGRWFEMMGSIFWGTTYTFTQSTSFKNLLHDLKVTKPSVFISIPKRWIQIQEHVAASIPIEKSDDKAIQKMTRTITGGNLKWGLSAAGFLDPDIFKFFHENNIALLSGYGMTEGTGGITMTPPEDYVPNSVGKSLPGIDLKLADDNELLLRGPYVSPGYYKDEIKGSYTDGWFHTGDIFNYKKGHYFIVDRKKEIYKNSRGQTISPQKIENLFQDFEAIRSVFLVGDGKEFNTILLYPEAENDAVDLKTMSPDEIRIYFSSLVFSVNTFLPPYERIVNYAIIPRDFDHDNNELTLKNTFKRKNVLENFADIIEPMYKKNYISLIRGDYEIQIPNWLLREKRLTGGDIRWDGKTIREYGLEEGLPLKWTKSALIIGDYVYHANDTTISFEKLLRDPTLWLGNQALIDFMGEVGFRVVSFEPYLTLSVNHLRIPFQKFNILLEDTPEYSDGELSLPPLHLAAHNLLQKDRQHVKSALAYFQQGLDSPKYQAIIQDQLLRLQTHPDSDIWARSFEMLMPHLTGEMFINLYRKSIHSDQSDSFTTLNPGLIQENHFLSILELLTEFRHSKKIRIKDEKVGKMLIRLITKLGINLPKYFTKSRGELTLWMLVSQNESLAKLARENRSKLEDGFREWIHSHSSAKEFNWQNILQFDENVSKELKTRINHVFINSTIICESTFIFSHGRLIQLNEIMPQGIWVSHLGHGHGKHVVRVLVQLKDGQAYNFVINMNESLKPAQFTQETNWLISMGATIQDKQLVEKFGSFWLEHQVYTEEYILGETVLQYLYRNENEIISGMVPDRWQMRWLHFIWNGATAYLEFWKRTGCTRIIKNASPKNVIIPEFDYYTGTRLVSISGRKKTHNIEDVFSSFYQHFILETEALFPGLKKMADWEILYTVVLEVFGIKTGSKILKTIKRMDKHSQKRVKLFLEEVNSTGLLRKQVVFASLRYQRWLDLNPSATHKARGIIIQDLYKDYKLQLMIEKYPETRIRFFLMTAFQDANPDLIKRLTDLMVHMRTGSVSEESLESYLHTIHDEIDLTEAEKYFLTRLVFEHVDAADYAELISRDMGSKGQLDLAVIIEGKSGQSFKIRPPFHPKEVARFHRLLLEAKLEVQFETQHEFLFVNDKKDTLAGGLFWKQTGPSIVHLEKIVIAPHYRNSHLSLRLAEEFFNRLRLKKYKYLTVGFFQAGFFYRLGFEIDQKFGGLVKRL